MLVLNSNHYFIMKLKANKNFNKLNLIIHPILTAKHYSLLFIKATLASDNYLRFKNILVEKI